MGIVQSVDELVNTKVIRAKNRSMQTFKKIFNLLNAKERKQASLLLLMILVMALLDMIGVASILPFMTVLTNPGIIETNLILNNMFQASKIIGVENNQQFLFVLGILVFILLVASLIFKAVTNYVQVRFVHMRQFSIGKRLLESYLYQPYSWFLNRHSADLGKTILEEVSQVVGNGIKPLMELIAKGFVSIAIITLLVLTDVKLALIVGIFFGGVYCLIYYFAGSYLNRIGKGRLESNQLRFLSLTEAFGAAKEVKVAGLEKVYIERFGESAQKFARTTRLHKL